MSPEPRFLFSFPALVSYYDAVRKGKIRHIFPAQCFRYFTEVFFCEIVVVNFTMKILSRNPECFCDGRNIGCPVCNCQKYLLLNACRTHTIIYRFLGESQISVSSEVMTKSSKMVIQSSFSMTRAGFHGFRTVNVGYKGICSITGANNENSKSI